MCCESREGRASEPQFTEGTGPPGLSGQSPARPHPRKPGASLDLSPIIAQERPYTNRSQLRNSLGLTWHPESFSRFAFPIPFWPAQMSLLQIDFLTTSAKKSFPSTPSLHPGPYFPWFFYHGLTFYYIFNVCLFRTKTYAHIDRDYFSLHWSTAPRIQLGTWCELNKYLPNE